jgi:hypothetical protein
MAGTSKRQIGRGLRRPRTLAVVLGLCLAAVAVWIGPAQRGAIFTGSPSAQAAAISLAQPTFAGGLSVRRNTTQVITMPHAGAITRIDLPLCTEAAHSAVALTLQDAAGKRLGVTGASFAVPNADCVWHEFVFHHPVAVRAGAVLTLDLVRTLGNAPLWASDAYNSNPYRGGSGRWMGHTINDFAFRVHLIPR